MNSMVIHTLERDGNCLNVFADEQGDIYVSTNFNSCVRIGGPGSGHTIPRKIRRLLMELAEEFEKYKDVRYEDEAFEIENKTIDK